MELPKEVWISSEGSGDYHVYTDESPDQALCGYTPAAQTTKEPVWALRIECEQCFDSYMSLLETALSEMSDADLSSVLSEVLESVATQEGDPPKED